MEEVTLLQQKTIRLHEFFIRISAVFCFLYIGIDVSIGQYAQAVTLIVSLLLIGVSFVLCYKRKYYVSKVWNMLVLTLMLQITIIQTGIDSYAFVYFMPIVIGSLFIFQGYEKRTGYLISGLNAILMVVSILYLDELFILPVMSNQMAELDGAINLFGVCAICGAETYFLIQVTDSFHEKLVAKTRALNLKNEQLLSTLYTRDRMMAVLSHDLRSPIASLDSAAEILQTDRIEPEMQRAILGQFKVRTSSVLDLIDKLLLWTRTQTNNIEYVERELTLIEIENMVRNVCTLSSSEKNIQYTVNFGASESLKVLGDKDMLDTIFRNLISNATKYSRDNGEVQITAQHSPQGWCFRIIDFGVGMSQNFLNKINSGEVLSTRGTSNEIGHGLGLQLVHDFLKKHSSHLMVSTLEGKGSEFYFYLKPA